MIAGQNYSLYIDESGVPELSALTDFCIVTGVLIKDDDEKSFLFLIERIKRKYNLDLNKHIHSVDIFQKKNDKYYLGKTLRRPTKDLRQKFQVDIWDVIKDYSLEHYTITVPKKYVIKTLGLNKLPDKGTRWINSSNYYARVDRQLPMDIGVNALYHWALKKIGEDGKLKIMLEGRSGDQFSIKNFGYIQDKNVFSNKWMSSFSRQFKEAVVSITFANKSIKAVGLELSDIISFTCNAYFLQFKKNITLLDHSFKKALFYKGIHKTLNSKHYTELNERAVKKYLPGLSSRTKRIAKNYSRHPLSPANTGAQIP